MGFWRRAPRPAPPPERPTLQEDLAQSGAAIAESLRAMGYWADFTLESLREIDRFFDAEHRSGGLLDGRCGARLFALGAYLGETLIRACGGRWMTDDSDPEGEINVAVELTGGTVLWPVQRVIKRWQNGAEDGIYDYGATAAGLLRPYPYRGQE